MLSVHHKISGPLQFDFFFLVFLKPFFKRAEKLYIYAYILKQLLSPLTLPYIFIYSVMYSFNRSERNGWWVQGEYIQQDSKKGLEGKNITYKGTVFDLMTKA